MVDIGPAVEADLPGITEMHCELLERLPQRTRLHTHAADALAFAATSGGHLLGFLMSTLTIQYRAIVVANSDLYPSGSSGKRDAGGFYLRHGFHVIARTTATRLLWKPLDTDRESTARVS